jgi:DNA polymerase/3'-5' exonuclease PolX
LEFQNDKRNNQTTKCTDEHLEYLDTLRKSSVTNMVGAFGWLYSVYNNKESFGDMDILYSTYDNKSINKNAFNFIFAPTEIVQNTNVISLDYKQLQIDFIHIKEDEFDYALNYFGNNDLGNLIGKIARQFVLKHGHNGLILPLRDGNNIFGKLYSHWIIIKHLYF